MFIVKTYQINVFCCCQRGDGCGRCACKYESRINLAVLKSLCTVAERLVCRFDILLNIQTVCAEYVNCVVIYTGTCRADRNILSCQICNGFDVRIQGNDLNLLHIQRCNCREILNLAVLFKQVGSIISISHNVGLYESKLCVTCIHRLDIGLRAAGCNCRNLSTGALAYLAGKYAAKAVICTLVSTCSEVQAGAAFHAALNGSGRLRFGCPAFGLCFLRSFGCFRSCCLCAAASGTASG